MIQIVNKVMEHKATQQRVYPVNSNRASVLGHPCDRYLVYMWTHWDKMELPEVDRQFIFDGGNMIEQMARRELEDAGFRVSNQGRDFKDPKYKLTGHVDCFVGPQEDHRANYPCEIKGISPFDFDKINSIEDMTKSEKTWVKAYPAQGMLYLFLANKEEGLFYIKNKLTYKPKEIWFKLDYDYVEWLLKRCENTNKHVDKGTLPDRLNDYKSCKNCQARHFCRPDIVFGEGIGFLDSEEIRILLNRRGELHQSAKEFKAIDTELKEGLKNYMKDRVVLICDEWQIEKKVSRSGAISFNFTKE